MSWMFLERLLLCGATIFSCDDQGLCYTCKLLKKNTTLKMIMVLVLLVVALGFYPSRRHGKWS
jgi:hypothetical protein